MRFAHYNFAAMAALTLTAAPLAAQSVPEPTKQESVDCMMATLPFYVTALSDNLEAAAEINDVGRFWSSIIIDMGNLSDNEMDELKLQSDLIISEFRKLDSEDDIAAFLTPYQAKFDACEDMRKAIQAG